MPAPRDDPSRIDRAIAGLRRVTTPPLPPDRLGALLRWARAWRPRRLLVLVAGWAAMALALAPLTAARSSSFEGTPGAIGALIGMLTAVVAGPLIGAGVAIFGAIFYIVAIGDHGPASLFTIPIWAIAAVVAGTLAEAAGALGRSEARVQRLADSNVIGTLVVDAERVTEANDLFLAIVGRSRAELEAGELWLGQLTAADDADRAAAGIEELLRVGAATPYEQDLMRSDGTRVPVLIGAVVVAREPFEAVFWVVDLSDRRRAEDAARTAGARVARLQAVTASLSGALTPASVADAVLVDGMAALGADGGCVAMVSADETMLTLLGAVGWNDELVAAWGVLAITDPAPLAAAARERTIVGTSTAAALAAADPRVGRLLAATDQCFWLFAPLLLEGRMLGALGVSFHEERTRAVEDEALLRALADQCAQALDRARLYGQELQAREALEAVLALVPEFQRGGSVAEVRQAVCRAARATLGGDVASLWSVEPDELRAIAFDPPEAGVEGSRHELDAMPFLRSALAAGRPLFVGDPRQTGDARIAATAASSGLLAGLGVPVLVDGVAELLLALRWHGVVREPGASELAVAQRFADQAGLAIEQARRREAQAEAEGLNETLRRLLDAAPPPQATASVSDAASAICEAAQTSFDAEAAAVWLRDGDGLRLACRTPESPSLPVGVRLSFADYPAFRRDLESGRPAFVDDVAVRFPRLWRSTARATGSRAQLRLPLASAGDTDALVVLSWTEPQPEPSSVLLALAARFADQAAVLLAEARRREAEGDAERLHHQLELGLLPTIAISDPSLAVVTRYRPGETRLRLGGDFYDCLQLESGEVAVMIGDVSGHGPDAAALGASLRAAWRALTVAGLDAAEVLPALERVMEVERPSPESFATICTGWLTADRSSFRFVSAGHPLPILLSAGASQLQAPPFAPLGFGVPAPRTTATAELPPGASIMLHTDGLIEGRAAPGRSERLGLNRLLALLAESRGPTGRRLDAVIAKVEAANGGRLADDLAVVVLGPATAAPLRLVLSSSADARAARAAVVAYAIDAGLGADRLADLALAVGEAVAGAVRDEDDLDGAAVELLVSGDDTSVDVTIRGGRGGLGASAGGAGLGLPIIAAVSDTYALAVDDEGRAELEMRFRLGAEWSAATVREAGRNVSEPLL